MFSRMGTQKLKIWLPTGAQAGMLTVQSGFKDGWRARNQLGCERAGRETQRDAAFGAEPDLEIERVERYVARFYCNQLSRGFFAVNRDFLGV